MTEMNCKLLIVGAGPGGYVCAIRAGQLGIDTVVVEGDRPGGTCLNVGCIPSKALIHVADEYDKLCHFVNGSSPIGISAAEPALDFEQTIAWKDSIVGRLNSGVSGLLRKAKVRLVHGWARFVDGKTVEVETDNGLHVIRAETLVIATGSVPVALPSLPFGGHIISSSDALAMTELPKRFAVVGGGYIGLELGIAFAKLGSQVTVIEALPRLLAQYDAELTRPVMRRLEALGVRIITGARAKALAPSGSGLLIETSEDTQENIAADKIMVTIGRRPRLDGFGLEGLDLTMAGACIRIDDQCRTSMRGVFAIGDATGEPMLAHRAMAQGEMVAEIVAGHRRSWDKQVIPAICFTDPEIVSVGLTSDDATAQGIKTSVGLFPFAANGRAMTKLGEDGFVRLISRADDNLVIGVQAVGQGVSELSAAFGLAIEMGARTEDVAQTVHAHPTQGEAFAEAALKSLGHALHI